MCKAWTKPNSVNSWNFTNQFDTSPLLISALVNHFSFLLKFRKGLCSCIQVAVSFNMSGSNRGGGEYIICFGLVGVCLLMTGSLSFSAHHKDSCLCGSDLYRGMDEGCPPHAPCLCVNADSNSTNKTCAPKKRGSGRSGPLACIIIGAVFSLPLALLVVYRLYALLRFAALVILDGLMVALQTLGNGIKRLYSKVSSLWTSKKIVPAEANEVASVELAPIEIEAQ